MSSFISVPSETQPNLPVQPVAPVWHTAVVLAVVLGSSALGAYRTGHPAAWGHYGIAMPRSERYVFAAAWEWLVVAFLWYGARFRSVNLRSLIGGQWKNPLAALRDLGIAVMFLLGANVILGFLSLILHAQKSQALRNFLPHTDNEIPAYLLLALTAGICEEIIFRGYLQRQFDAWTQSAAAALAIQGLIFGAAHGYQGFKHMIVIAVFGWMFGALALWRRSLRPGMLAHALQDGVLGVLVRHLLQ